MMAKKRTPKSLVQYNKNVQINIESHATTSATYAFNVTNQFICKTCKFHVKLYLLYYNLQSKQPINSH